METRSFCTENMEDDTYSGEKTVSPEQVEHQRTPTPEGIRMQDQERNIQEDVDFLEEVEELEEDVDFLEEVEELEQGDDLSMQDQERNAIQENADFVEEVEDIEQVDEVEEGQQLHEDPRDRIRRENASMRQQIETEILQLKQSCANFRQIIDELRKHPTCPPRRFGLGAIRKQGERLMRCAFCRSIGRHYSDSCIEIRSVFVRRRMIEDRGRCEECLEYCHGGTSCPKYDVRCFHCWKYGHHSALCELPDKSEEIAERRARARRSLAEAMDRIEKLERDLRFFQE
nr:hypothetical protein HCOI_01735800 [Haemonchus contortus]